VFKLNQRKLLYCKQPLCLIKIQFLKFIIFH